MIRARGPWLLLVPLAVMLAAALHLARDTRERAPAAPGGTPPDAVVAGFAGVFSTADGAVSVRLAPLHGEPGMQEHEARVLARRFDLPEGAPWRIVLSRAVDRLDGVEVVDTDGVALQPIGRWIGGGDPRDPLRVLLASRLPLEDGAGLLLWGRTPGGACELVLPAGKPAGAPSSSPLIPDGTVCGELPRHVARLATPPSSGTAED